MKPVTRDFVNFWGCLICVVITSAGHNIVGSVLFLISTGIYWYRDRK